MSLPSAPPSQPARHDAAPAGSSSRALTAVSTLLKQLHRLTTETYPDTSSLLDDYLRTGCKLFELPVGIVSRIEGDVYTVRAAYAQEGDAFERGVTFDLADTYCAWVVNEQEVVSHAHAGEALGHPAYIDVELAAYISAPIWVDGAIYGTLNFSSTAPRQRAFTAQEREIANVMAQTIGRVLERDHEELAREETEAALHQSRAILRRTNRIARVGGWELDVATGALLWTDEVYRIHELPADHDPCVEEALDFYPDSSRAEIEAAVSRAIEHGEPYDLEVEFVTAKGNKRWVRAIGEAERSDGTTTKLLGVFQDITARKEAEEELEEELQFRHVLLDQMNAGVVACDAGGQLTFFNRAASTWHGLPPEPIAQEDWPAHYSLFRADGTTPLPLPEVPLLRALKGENVQGAEMVIAPRTGPARAITCNGQPICNDDGELLGAVAVMHDMTRRKGLEKRLIHQANHDALTGLPNLKHFLERCHQAVEAHKEEGTPYAVLFLDLNRFKSINDSLGHYAGDQLLRDVAARLRTCLRGDDLVARLGGDEFGLLLNGPRRTEDAEGIAERIAEVLRGTFHLNGCPVHTSASIGVVYGSERHASPEDLLREADTAMYRAKHQQSGPVLFEPAMGEKAKTKFHLEADLHRAIKEDELRVFFQPIVQLDTGALTGFEALVRWQHPERGLLAPGAFIEVAEEAGLIPDLDRWMIGAACRQAQRWQDRHGEDLLLLLNVNCSHHTFLQFSLIDHVEAILAETCLSPDQLAIEITERMLIEDMDAAVSEMGRFRNRRIRLCIDDFGVEYSSLGALQQLPVDTIKVDRSFVQRVDGTEEGNALVRAIADLAHGLDLALVAEGIETPEQLAAMQALGYHYGQGYLFARPLDAEATARLLRGEQTWKTYWS